MASKPTFTPPKLQKRSLKGHQKPVLCLAHSSERLAYTSRPNSSNDNATHPSLLLSGSEDGTSRLWDLRTNKTVYCMVLPKSEAGEVLEVTSVAFHPNILDGSRDDGCMVEVNDAILDGSKDCTVYVSASNQVYGYDLRYHAMPLTTQSKALPSPIISTPHIHLSNHFQCTDEINQLSFSYPKHNEAKKEYFVSAACDSGEVHICQNVPYAHHVHNQQQQANENVKLLRHAESELHAIVSCSVFRPRVNDLQIASCGMDCRVKLWDVKKPRKPLYSYSVKTLADLENSSQLCNPPFVHSLSWSPSGRYLAAGLGDGSCLILSAEGRKLIEACILGWSVGGHKASVAAVCFPCFGLAGNVSKKAAMNGTADDRLLISAGNDGNIFFWDLGRDIVGNDAADPAIYLSGNKINQVDSNVTSKLETLDLAESSDDIIPEDLLSSPPKVLFQIPHQKKANWICAKAVDATSPCSLFVADTTDNISMYSLILS